MNLIDSPSPELVAKFLDLTAYRQSLVAGNIGARETCAPGGRFPDALCHGPARDRTGHRRTAYGKGYTPSVWSLLARLVERAGQFSDGSITAFYTVLMEGDDQQDPLVDSVRSLLDGHIVLDRKLAQHNHYPPISILDSLSRLMPAVASASHLRRASELRRLLAVYARSEDLIRVGAYQKGADPALDKAIELLPAINAVLQQRPDEVTSLEQTVQSLLKISV